MISSGNLDASSVCSARFHSLPHTTAPHVPTTAVTTGGAAAQPTLTTQCLACPALPQDPKASVMPARDWITASDGPRCFSHARRERAAEAASGAAVPWGGPSSLDNRCPAVRHTGVLVSEAPGVGSGQVRPPKLASYNETARPPIMQRAEASSTLIRLSWFTA